MNYLIGILLIAGLQLDPMWYGAVAAVWLLNLKVWR